MGPALFGWPWRHSVFAIKGYAKPFAQSAEDSTYTTPGDRHHGCPGARGAPRPSRPAFPGDTVVRVQRTAFVPLHSALVRIDDEESVMLVEKQRLWPSVERQLAPAARRCVFGRLANRQNETSRTMIVRSLNDQRAVTIKCLALGHRPA